MTDDDDAPQIHVGCVGFDGPLGLYFNSVNARELGPKLLTARPETLKKWRAKSPPGARFVPWVDEAVANAHFRGPDAEAGWARLLEAAAILESDTVLLRTAASFRPTAENKRAMLDFFTAERRGALQVAWWAEGLWEGAPEERDAMCQAAGLLPAVDPLALDEDEAAPPGPHFYWRVLGRRGGGGRLSDYDLDTLLDLCGERVAGYVMFGAQSLWSDARRFALLAGAAPSTD